ncbi:hypothetical protein P3T76_006802 [Phytophthora citrophthora]|uniref:RxLR effector protein n=1 Tax=Phytophthora citrophthora TaxID=4793 RepID=A0AAD9LLV0_9STRA|nr:hypothetical protein P3T76_006802 [Phytophthora citrophthora]
MRLTFLLFAAALAVFASTSDAVSVDQATGVRSLRRYQANEEERGITAVSTSIDDVLSKLNKQKSSLSKLISKKKLNTMLTEESIKRLRGNKSYMDKVFTNKKLDKMLVNPNYAEKKFVEWYALGLTDKTIMSRLSGVGDHFGTLHTQYVVFINRLHGVA